MQNTQHKTKLSAILENKRIEVDAAIGLRPLEQLKQLVDPCSTKFSDALRDAGVCLIAELKPKSPSAGTLKADVDIASIISSYSEVASAISVLTDNKYFGGSMDVLHAVSQLTTKPLLCKDFIIDEYQIYQAREAGAAAVLLIVKILSDQLLCELAAVARAIGMTPIIEIQNERELQAALQAEPEVLLINNRDLATFDIDLGTTKRLAPLIGPGIAVVSASGIECRSDIEALLPFTNKFLIGSALMRADCVTTKLRELCGIC
jgi:indole-3-glycerol phosphate synthase/phosphoribosylanthranilate isomerase